MTPEEEFMRDLSDLAKRAQELRIDFWRFCQISMIAYDPEFMARVGRQVCNSAMSKLATELNEANRENKGWHH
jgi:hypothetical protein